MNFDEEGMWNWSSMSGKEPIATSNDYEEEIGHVDKTLVEPETSNKEQRQRILLA